MSEVSLVTLTVTSVTNRLLTRKGPEKRKIVVAEIDQNPTIYDEHKAQTSAKRAVADPVHVDT